MRRVVRPELLDSDNGTPAEVAASLADLRRINRWFGGTSTTYRLVRRVVERTGRTELSLLDVAAGSGDIPHAVQARLLRAGVRLEVTLLDRALTHLPRHHPAVVGDALTLPFRDASFDLVSCALFLHHLEPEEIVRCVDEALRAARVAVLLNDLRRHPLHLALVYAGMPLYRSRLTRHDGPISIHRSYTSAEMLELLRQTRATSWEMKHTYLFRMGVVVWKQPPEAADAV